MIETLIAAVIPTERGDAWQAVDDTGRVLAEGPTPDEAAARVGRWVALRPIDEEMPV